MSNDITTGFSRRRLIQAGLVSSTAGIAGCSGDDSSDSDTSGNTPADEKSGDDSGGPTILTAETEPSQHRGQIRFLLEAEDTQGISELIVATPSDEVTEAPDDTRERSIEGALESPPGERSEVTFRVTNERGDSSEVSVQTYARRADVLQNSPLDVGAMYRFAPQSCVAEGPTIGNYEGISPEVVPRHVDDLQRAGVSRVVVSVDQAEQIERAIQFSEAPLGDEVTIQFRLQFRRWLKRGVSLEDQLQNLREGINRISRYDTIDNRPVILLPDLQSVDFADTPQWDELLSKFDDLTVLVDFIRTELTIDDVTPFLIGETGKVSEGWASPRLHVPGSTQDLLGELDGIQNGLVTPYDIVRTEDTYDSMDTTWEGLLQKQFRILYLFAEKRNIAFIPRVAPGIVNSVRGCPPDEQVSRSQSRFDSLLRYAGAYATHDRITIDSYNDWRTGSQIEPGSMMGTNYGDSYLDGMREAVKQGAVFDQGGREVYHVREDGTNWNPGSESDPLATLQEALLRAGPGATVQVHPGTYQEHVWTVRDGEPDAPITITGPAEAVLQPPEVGEALWIKNSHVRLTGLTIDGLLDPDRPDDVESYSRGALIQGRPPDDTDEYLDDIVCAPAGIGNAERSAMVFQRTKNLEVGPLRIIGLAGAEYVVGDKQSHVGEFLYLGQPPRVIEGREHPEYNWDQYPWKGELDQTRHVHVHHIDNSAGHPHSQLVNTKTGTYDVLVEYCTDAGGSFNTEPWNKCADVRFQSYDATLRWCVLQNGDEHAIQIGDPNRGWLEEQEDPEIAPEISGTSHSIYRNTIEGFGEKALQIDTTAEEQELLCGNEITETADGDVEQSCPRDVPTGDGRGHLGGDSPWSDV